MSTAYRVKRPEPLAVNDIKVVFQGTLDGLNTLTEVEGDDNWDDGDQHDDMDREDREDDEGYVKSVYATITGKTASGERETIGHQLLSAGDFHIESVLSRGGVVLAEAKPRSVPTA